MYSSCGGDARGSVVVEMRRDFNCAAYFAAQRTARNSQLGWWQRIKSRTTASQHVSSQQAGKPTSQQERVRLSPNTRSRLSTMAAAILTRRRDSLAATLIGVRSPAAATAVCIGNSWREIMRPMSTAGVGAGERHVITALVQKSRSSWAILR